MINSNYWPKAVYCPDECILVFYCDDIDHNSEGLVFPVPDYMAGLHRQVPLEVFIDTCLNNVPWTSYVDIALNAAGVVFADSFRCYRPNYCTG